MENRLRKPREARFTERLMRAVGLKERNIEVLMEDTRGRYIGTLDEHEG